MKISIGAPALVFFMPAVAFATDPPSFSDTYIGYRYSNSFSDPGKPQDIGKNILQVTHVSSYALGQQFANLDVFKSDHNDLRENSDSGATEVYLTYRNQLQYGRVFSRPLAFGPVRDVALSLGFDWNTKDNAFQSRKRMLVVGPTIKVTVPVGFLDVSLYYAREWNHCGLDVCDQPANHSWMMFDPFFQANVNWGLPFTVADNPMKFQGFISVNGEKGEDYRNNPTSAERLMRTSLMTDVGRFASLKKNVLWVGPGYEYWRNKFGNSKGYGIDVNALSINLEWHL
ncbi:hypothetical protein [Pseudomonas sp. ME-P-057]|uniref:hypothetical protein n=1 Tax=Pseudomonas sp. ME-P-057 TaxID=3040321 RepID=UPI00255501E6|nr:hypothetical protein [Pseudomonas sp. ME-P-057]